MTATTPMHDVPVSARSAYPRHLSGHVAGNSASTGNPGSAVEPQAASFLDPASYQSASRLISETAHDLRAPLTTIREAVRLVRDGDLGNVTSAQQECLSAAINQCNCAAQLVDEMVQSRRFDSGFPNVSRQWISVDQLRSNVESTLQPWMMPRGIHLLWDGPFGIDAQVYADANLIRRLLVNLAGNAIRVTRDGCAVLIRAVAKPNQRVMQWSIVDQGVGITSSDLELIAAGKSPAKSVGGLGLMISRQLAAAHFSTLRIESRVGTGTAVSFQTPMGGPAAVAQRWASWRAGLIDTPGRMLPNESQRQVHEVLPARGRSASSPSTSAPIPPRRVRIDQPAQLIEIAIEDIQPAFTDHVALTTVSVGAAIPASGTDAFDNLLQRSMRFTELAYRTGRRSWVIAWDADGESAIAKRLELERLVQIELDGIRISWGHSNIVAASAMTRNTQTATKLALASRLSDLLVRQTLVAAQQSVRDADQVRLGTAAVEASPIAANRLDKEIGWLTEKRRHPS